jgi:hypothetical protein
MLKGICIGGPLDGLIKEAETDQFRAHKPIPKKPVPWSGSFNVSALENIPVTEYRYEFWRTSRLSFGMWIADDLTLEDALERLFRNYRKLNL